MIKDLESMYFLSKSRVWLETVKKHNYYMFYFIGKDQALQCTT